MAIVHGRAVSQERETRSGRRRVVVKLRPETVEPQRDAVARDSVTDTWRGITDRYPGVNVRPYFTTAPEARAGESADATPSPSSLVDGRLYVEVDVPEGVSADEVAATLRGTAGVDVAYPEAGPTPPPVDASDDPRNPDQRYLDSAPAGVGARAIWPFVDGSGIGFVDLERGWTLNHEDLEAAGIDIISGVSRDFHGHGTAVLGEVVGVDNTVGGVGIAPGARTRVVSQWRSDNDNDYRTADAILSAAVQMDPGDVLLLEAQTRFTTSGDAFVPVEVEELVFNAIRAAVDRGIVVVEAAGNGSVDLDAFQDLNGRQVLNRNSADFRDSGAVMVGAGSSDAPHQRLGFSNFGSRIDCYAWGEHIDTSGDGMEGRDPHEYTTGFGGTSGASPIVTGCAILLQAVRRANGQPPLTPADMRAVLSDGSLNTPSANPGFDLIGVMPNLESIVQGRPVDLALRPQGVAVSE